MLGREVVVISGWVGLGKMLCVAMGKSHWVAWVCGMLTSSIFQVGLGGGGYYREG